MDVTKIPFVEKVGIVRTGNGLLELPFSAATQNHLNTFFASAQFTLAETASGDMLQSLFPELVGRVVPVLRDSSVKFRKPAISAITAHATVSDDAASRFMEQLSRKGRSSIPVEVELKDAEGVVTCTGTFNWFVQSLS